MSSSYHLFNSIHSSRITTTTKLIFIILLLTATLNIVLNANIKLIEPYDIEINFFSLTAASFDQITTSTQFQSTFTVIITKLIHPPQHYQIVYGYRYSKLLLDAYTGTLTTRIYGPSNGNTKLSPTFEFKYYHYLDSTINNIQINYMLIGKALLDTLSIRAYYLTIDSPDPTCNGLVTLVSCTYIKPITLAHLNYRTYISMTGITYTKNTSPTTNLLKFDLKIASITHSALTLTLQAEYLNINTFQFYFLAIHHQIFQLTNPKSTLIIENLSNLTATTHPHSFSHFFPEIINHQNHFIGISKYQGQTILFTDFTVKIQEPIFQKQIFGWLSSFCKSINIFTLAMYGFAPPCSLYRNCLYCYIIPDLFCTQCKQNFKPVPISGGNTDCQCQLPLQLVSGICDTIPFGCTIVERLNDNSILCHLCDPMKFLTLNQSNNSCVCSQNYFMDSNNVCHDYCGDGIIMQSQCDDGNQVSGDGCSLSCSLQPNFSCDTSVQPTNCKSPLMLLYKVKSILKNSNSNSAIIKMQLRNPSIYHLPVLKHQFEPPSSHIKLKIILSHNPYIEVPLSDLNLLSINDKNEIQIEFFYTNTVEKTQGCIQFNYQLTKYTNYTQSLEFLMMGDNFPLKFEDKIDTYQKMGIGFFVGTILDVLFLLIGLISPKFIGLESVLTMQLVFFSQILIHDNNKFPVGFLFLQNLQYSAGFNKIFDLTDYIPVTQGSIKMYHIKREKLIIQNFNLNSVILLVSFICLLISFTLRSRNEKIVELNKGSTIRKLQRDDTEIPKYIPILKKVNDLMFFLANQVAFWLFLPLLSAITAKFQIEDYTVTTDLSGKKFKSEVITSNVTAAVGFLVIFSIVLNNFKNFWLSPKTMRLQYERPEEEIYKRVLFIYLIIVGSLIFFANQIYIVYIYCSSIVLGLHLIFMTVIIALNPYKYSLKVHTIGMIINNVIYLVFLIVINMINYVDQIDSDISLFLGFTMLGLCGLSIIFTVIRLYYELRYGRKLQDKLAKQKLKKQQEQKILKLEQLKRKRAQMESQATKRLSQIQKIRNMNVYLYQNQILEDNKKQLVEWLQNRTLFDEKTKELKYFQTYPQKPLDWYKKNQPKKYEQKIQQVANHHEAEKEKYRKKNQDLNYQMIAQKLRRQVISAKIKKNQGLKNHEQKLRTMPEYAMEIMKRGQQKYLHKAYDLSQ